MLQHHIVKVRSGTSHSLILCWTKHNASNVTKWLDNNDNFFIEYSAYKAINSKSGLYHIIKLIVSDYVMNYSLRTWTSDGKSSMMNQQRLWPSPPHHLTPHNLLIFLIKRNLSVTNLTADIEIIIHLHLKANL